MYLIRYPIWLGQGYFQSTQARFERQAKHFEPHALNVSLVGKVAVVTDIGANSGLGKATTLSLLTKGVMVHMVCCNWEHASKAWEEILEEARQEVAQSEITDHLKNNLIVDQMSLDNLPSICAFVEKFANQLSSHCNILVNNAGGLLQMASVTPEGIQHSFATNILGTYYLTELLVPLLARTGSARVVMVSSGGMFLTPLDLDNLESMKKHAYSGNVAYSHKKRQQVELTQVWARTYSNAQGIHFLSMHPGWADMVTIQIALPSFYNQFHNVFCTPAEGVDTIIWAAMAKAAQKVPNGSFLEDRQVTRQNLPFCWTQTQPGDPERLYTQCRHYATKVMGDVTFELVNLTGPSV
ncbi:Dehydrogenase/reductase SDR member 12 [Dimargaris cristalligena]|nr:Dehydrogenase/reductase SDR member 12 [Dimargaris cristalligena]